MDVDKLVLIVKSLFQIFIVLFKALSGEIIGIDLGNLGDLGDLDLGGLLS